MAHGEWEGAMTEMAKRIVVDFDNTMGVPGCDIDDGLALLFLLGNPELAQVEAVCTAYGNSDIDTVGRATASLMDALASAGARIPVHRGAASPDDPDSDAARFLARVTADNPGQIHIVALGSLTNLRGAAAVDPAFFANAASITLMGGITETLAFNGAIMNELNLSCDPAAARAVLEAPCPVRIATSQHCLPALFALDDFRKAFDEGSWVHRTCRYWFDDMAWRYGTRGFVCWDVVAAAALIRPDLFKPEQRRISLNDRFLGVGLLERAAEGVPCAVAETPAIAEPARFRAEVLAAWRRAAVAIS